MLKAVCKKICQRKKCVFVFLQLVISTAVDLQLVLGAVADLDRALVAFNGDASILIARCRYLSAALVTDLRRTIDDFANSSAVTSTSDVMTMIKLLDGLRSDVADLQSRVSAADCSHSTLPTHRSIGDAR